jgi:hypothetical protein
MLHCMNHVAGLGTNLCADGPLTFQQLDAIGFINPLRAIRVDPEAFRCRHRPLLEFCSGRFSLLPGAAVTRETASRVAE